MIATATDHGLVSNRLTDDDVHRRSTAERLGFEESLTEQHWPRHEIRQYIPGGTLVIDWPGDPPAWLTPTFSALAELLWLPPNWDSYGAYCVEPAHVVAMLNVLLSLMRDDTPPPSVGPTNRGGVQVEWHQRGIDLEIETRSTQTLRVSFEDLEDGTGWDRELVADWGPLTKCIKQLSPP